jgi:general secretion pathway protein D
MRPQENFNASKDMNAKFLLLALLVTVSGLRAQTPPPAATTPPAPGADWSALSTNATTPSASSNGAPTLTRPTVDPAAIAARLAQAQSNRVARNIALPGAPAAAATAPAATAGLPAADSMAMTVRPAATASTIPNPDEIVPAGSIDWTAAPLKSVLEVYTLYVGRNLLYPSTLNMKTEIVLKQTTPLTKLEVVQMIEAVLYLNQVSLINVGDKFVTIMPAAEAAKIPGTINTNDVSLLPDLGNVITHIVQLKYTKPSEMVNVLTPFVSGGSASPITPVDSSGMLVLRDNVANVKRMLEMIEKVDVVAQSEIISEVIPIKYAKAEEIASALSSVGGSTSGTVGTRATGTSRTTGAGAANRPGGLNQPGATYNQPGATGLPGTTPTPAASFGDRVRNLISRAAGSDDFTILGETKIIADIRSNSLLVFASRQDMEMIKDIISKLDVVLAQVLIETIIMDVTLSDNWNLGFSGAQYGHSFSKNTSGAGGVVGNAPFLSSLTNAFPSNLPTGLSYFGALGAGPEFEVAFQAFASDSRVNVIQKPRIQTSHATPAAIFIGRTVPYVSGTYYGYGAGTGGSSSYQQLQVGICLNVTPFINQDGLVVMTIEQTIDELDGTTTIQNVGEVPNTKKSTLTAEIAVRDKEAIILGGIINNSDDKNKSGVPLLKDIPVIGHLFTSSSSRKRRQELIVLMRPTVLRTPELAALQVDVEKQRLPGVRAAERALDKVELQRAEADRKADRAQPVSKQSAPAPEKTDFSKTTPFTPEEEQLLLNPTP